MSFPLFQAQIGEIMQNGFTRVSFGLEEPMAALNAQLLGLLREETGGDAGSLEEAHRVFNPEKINAHRLSAIRHINAAGFKDQFIKAMTPFFGAALGADLAVQKNLNLLVTPPGDPTSILPLHADTGVGHSAFELTVLFPLTPVTAAQNMFFLPLAEWRKNRDVLKSGRASLAQLTRDLREKFHYLELQPGQAFIFWHHLPHGNAVNQSDKTLWALNLRFKNAFTPYGEKGMGEYFKPLQLSPFNEFVFRESAHADENSRLHHQ